MKETIVILSYWPLLYPGDHGAMPGSTLRMEDFDLSSLPHVDVQACLWLRKGEGITPVFVLDQAREVADHLTGWTEGQPQDWFKIFMTDNGVNYCVALFPDFRRSVDRWKLNYQVINGSPVPPNLECTVLLQPLAFRSRGITKSYRRMSQALPASMSIGVLDSKEVDMSNPFATDSDKIINLGSYELTGLDAYRDWSDKFLMEDE